MKNKLYIIIGAVLLVIVGVFTLGNKTNSPTPSLGSISSDAFAYNSTTTNFVWSADTTGHQIKNGQGILGSVVIGNATAVGTMTLYDATTTINGGVYGTTTIAVINTGSPGGTYTYDRAFKYGLLSVSSATLATSTITTK